MTKPGSDLLDDPIAWGRRLIETSDHDPLYQGLVNWDVRGSRKRRFMLAYWCCYSVGASWWLSNRSGNSFWDALRVAAANESPSPLGGRWPRAHERRHWRGQKCVNSVDWLRGRFGHPEEACISLERATSLVEVNALMNWPQFGPWIAFKSADMLERVLGVPVAFPSNLLSMYKDPKLGAEMVSGLLDVAPDDVLEAMLHAYRNMEAPGLPGRRVNVQEIETVLCKFKSARHGRYWIGCDTHDHRVELENWGARDLLDAYPTVSA